MKTLLTFILFVTSLQVPAQILSINPDSCHIGIPTYSVWITGNGLFANQYRVMEISLSDSNSNYIVYSWTAVPQNNPVYSPGPDSLFLTMIFPPFIADTGLYDLVVKRKDLLIPLNYYYDTLFNAFRIHFSDGCIKGQTYNDSNRNQIYDGNESLVFLQGTLSSSASDYYNHDMLGYTFYAFNGFHNVRYNEQNDYVLTTPYRYDSLLVSNDTLFGIDFGVTWALDSLVPASFQRNSWGTATIHSYGLFDTLQQIYIAVAFYNSVGDSICPATANFPDSNRMEIQFYADGSGTIDTGYYDLIVYNSHNVYHLTNALYISDTLLSNLVTKEKTKPEILFSPNPVSQRIKFNVKIHFIKIFDITGNLLYEETVDSNELDVSYLKSGIYLMVMEFESKTFYKKLIKL